MDEQLAKRVETTVYGIPDLSSDYTTADTSSYSINETYSNHPVLIDYSTPSSEGFGFVASGSDSYTGVVDASYLSGEDMDRVNTAKTYGISSVLVALSEMKTSDLEKLLEVENSLGDLSGHLREHKGLAGINPLRPNYRQDYEGKYTEETPYSEQAENLSELSARSEMDINYNSTRSDYAELNPGDIATPPNHEIIVDPLDSVLMASYIAAASTMGADVRYEHDKPEKNIQNPFDNTTVTPEDNVIMFPGSIQDMYQEVLEMDPAA